MREEDYKFYDIIKKCDKSNYIVLGDYLYDDLIKEKMNHTEVSPEVILDRRIQNNPEAILDKMNIQVIELYLRKKKLEKLNEI
jgi:hypothetical protein